MAKAMTTDIHTLISELRRLREAATPQLPVRFVRWCDPINGDHLGSGVLKDGKGHTAADSVPIDLLCYLTAAANAVPLLVAELEELEKQVAALRADYNHAELVAYRRLDAAGGVSND